MPIIHLQAVQQQIINQLATVLLATVLAGYSQVLTAWLLHIIIIYLCSYVATLLCMCLNNYIYSYFASG